MKENSSNKLTEKRICRCMYYYGKNDDKCRKCPLDKKFRNISNKFKIIDYEVPTEFVIEDCGGIDLLIKDEETGEMYATEVKPKNSSETLVRMVAEIFTYTANDTDVYKKAIAFFSDSKQEKDYFNELYMKDENFNYILNQVTVFRIVANEKDDGVIDYYLEILNKEQEDALI